MGTHAHPLLHQKRDHDLTPESEKAAQDGPAAFHENRKKTPYFGRFSSVENAASNVVLATGEPSWRYTTAFMTRARVYARRAIRQRKCLRAIAQRA
jgi:hypothetical protein